MNMKLMRLPMLAALFAAAVTAQAAVEMPDVAVTCADGELRVPADGLKRRLKLAAEPRAARLSARTERTALSGDWVSRGGLSARVLRVDNRQKRYSKFTLELKNGGKAPVEVKSIGIFREWTPEAGAAARRVGNTDGAVADFPDLRIYVGVENPLAKLTVENNRVTAVLPREYAISPGEAWQVSWVVGRYRPGQLRRDFHLYLNQERAHPYRVLPHYNSWYDLNIGRNDAPWEKRMDEAEALGVMKAFRQEMGKRGVFIDSYLWDDGWDNWDSLWDFHPGFPNGFKALADEAHKEKGASIGAWMSPCGGYGGSCARRVAYARSQGIIGPKDGLLRMSAPKYYAAFRDRVLKMIADYDMNIFKFDRMGVGHDCDGAPPSAAPDMEAIVRLIGEMRAAKQDVFVNATVGTWASPFWVMFADSIWRGGNDFGQCGAGSARQKWITYRDNVIHDRFVAKSPLFPLNSLMSHGIIVSRHGPPNCTDVSDTPRSGSDFADEVWMSVACGTDLQEYYITPSLMHPSWWDTLADGVKWLKANAAVLEDVHWVGGDPDGSGGAGVYGYASWKALAKGAKGIAILRNPSAEAQCFTATLAELFELPAKAPAKVRNLRTVRRHDVEYNDPKTVADKIDFKFEPFGLVLFEVQF